MTSEQELKAPDKADDNEEYVGVPRGPAPQKELPASPKNARWEDFGERLDSCFFVTCVCSEARGHWDDYAPELHWHHSNGSHFRVWTGYWFAGRHVWRNLHFAS